MAFRGHVLRCALGLVATGLQGSLVASEAPCGVDGACAADDVGLLQTRLAAEREAAWEDAAPLAPEKQQHFVVDMRGANRSLLQTQVEAALASVPEKHLVIDMRGEKDAKADGCKPGISVHVSKTSIPEDTSLSYNFPELSGRSYCTDEDDHGPRECCEAWGGDATMHYNLKSAEVPTPEWTAHITATIQANILWSWVDVGHVEASCGLCDCECTIPQITLAGLVTIDSRTFQMPKCPEKAEFIGTVDLMLPTDLSVPMDVRGQAEVQLKRPNGEVFASTQATCKLSPP